LPRDGEPSFGKMLQAIFWRVGLARRSAYLVIGVKMRVAHAHTSDGDHCGRSQIPRNHVMGRLESEG
jgi:hypothetical protein